MKVVTCFISELSSTRDTAFTLLLLNLRWKRIKNKVHANRDRTCSKFFHFGHGHGHGHGHVGVCKCTNDLAYIRCMQYHWLTLSHTVRHLHKAQTGNINSNKFPKKCSDIHEIRAGIVLHWMCAHTFYLRPSRQSSDKAEGKRKVQMYCYGECSRRKT